MEVRRPDNGTGPAPDDYQTGIYQYAYDDQNQLIRAYLP